jgi:tetratricopeptide (TPR) repeat protein
MTVAWLSCGRAGIRLLASRAMPDSFRPAAWMLLCCLLAVGALPWPAHAQADFQRSLDTAVRLYKDLEYEQALEQLQKARRLALGNDQEVSVSLHEGIILGDMGQRDESRAAFRKGLRMNPDAKLPFKVSPKLQSDFSEVQAEVRQERLNQELAAAPKKGTDQPRQPDLRAPPAQPDPLVSAKEGAVRTRVPVAPLVFAGVGVAAAGVGTVFGLQSRSNVEEARKAYAGVLPPQSELGAVDARMSDARGQARMANVLFGTAVVAAGGAVVTWLLQSDDTGAAPEGTR